MSDSYICRFVIAAEQLDQPSRILVPNKETATVRTGNDVLIVEPIEVDIFDGFDVT